MPKVCCHPFQFLPMQKLTFYTSELPFLSLEDLEDLSSVRLMVLNQQKSIPASGWGPNWDFTPTPDAANGEEILRRVAFSVGLGLPTGLHLSAVIYKINELGNYGSPKFGFHPQAGECG